MWRIREERREIATEMARLWREDPEQWLLKSKILWAQRHEARRGQGRSEVPTAKSLSGRGNIRPSSDKNTRASGGKLLSGLPNRFGRSAVSLKMLIESGHMQAGPDVVWISYLNQTWSAELDAEGVIKFEGKEYNSPSAWAIFCKRIANPGCYPTGMIALTRPLVDAGYLPKGTGLVVHAVSGYSGGGKQLMAIYQSGEAEPWGAYGERRRHVPAFPAVSSPNPNEIKTQSE